MTAQTTSPDPMCQLLLKYETSSELIQLGQQIDLKLALEQVGDTQEYRGKPPVLLLVNLSGFRCVDDCIPEKFRKYIVGNAPSKNWFPCYLDIPVEGAEGLITKTSPKIEVDGNADQLEIRICAFYNGSLIQEFEKLEFTLQEEGSYRLQEPPAQTQRYALS